MSNDKSGIIVIIGLIVLGALDTSLGFHISAFVLGVGFGVISPTFQAMANAKVSAQDRGAVNSTYLTFFDAGIGIGMLLYGFLFEMIGYANTFYLTAIIQVGAMVLFLSVTYPKYKKRLK